MFWGIAADIGVVAIYVGFLMYFKSKGFLKSMQTIISLFLTVVLISLFSPAFEDVVADSPIGKYVDERVESTLVREEEREEITDSGLPDFFEASLNETIKNIDDTKNDVMQVAANEISALILRIISAISLFLLVKIVVFLIFKILELFCHFKIFGFANKFLGLAVGIVNATIVIYVICAALSIFLPQEGAVVFKEIVSKTYITKFFCNNNIIIKMFI